MPVKKAKEKTTTAKKKRKSHLEENFALMLGQFIDQREYKFHPERRWRFDFAWPDIKVAVEIEGGAGGFNIVKDGRRLWMPGAHQSPEGYVKDCEKYNEAAFMGWYVFRLPNELITAANAQKIIKFVLDKKAQVIINQL